MIPLPLRQKTAYQLSFAHQPMAGWIAVAVAAAIYGGVLHIAGGWRYMSSSAGLFVTFACGSVMAVGLFAGLWRHRLTVYRRHRRWTRERGLWPLVERTEGTLGEARVVLERKAKRHPEAGHTYSFPVALHLGEGITPALLGSGTARVHGERLMVEMARQLELPAVDASGPKTITTPHQELEMPPDPHARQ